MGEILYRPITDEKERHLVQSRENPGRVRGQTRDKNNKNPDIIEWEPVEIQDYEYELKKLAHDERIAEIQARQSKADTITSFINLIDTIMTFLGEHPQVVVTIVQKGGKIRKEIVNIKSKLVTFTRNKKKSAEKPFEKVVLKPMTNDVKSMVKVKNEVAEDILETEQLEWEDMSVEEARELIWEILLDYISMKKKWNRLSNANIKNMEKEELNMDNIIAQLDSLIKKYPTLMDESTIEYISILLKKNTDLQENAKIKEILKME